ncbi:Unknown protein, partial [Striga hermonthica]
SATAGRRASSLSAGGGDDQGGDAEDGGGRGAQAVQQGTSHTSHATTALAMVVGSQDKDVSCYGDRGGVRDRAMERMAEQLRQLRDKVEWRPESRARGKFSRPLCQIISGRPTWCMMGHLT